MMKREHNFFRDVVLFQGKRYIDKKLGMVVWFHIIWFIIFLIFVA